MNSNAKWITRTGLMVALVVVSQFIGKMIPPVLVFFGPFNISQLITGSLVNLILVLSAVTIGLWSGVTVGVLSSVLATLLGIGPIFPIITPAIAVSNIIIVVIASIFFNKAERSGNAMSIKVTGIIVGSIVKCAFLWVTVPMLFKLIPEIKPQQATMLTIMFSWPQAITALVGGFLAMLVIPSVKRALKNR